MTDRPKYSLTEFERRWLVEKKLLPDLSELEETIITDKYFPGTRTRLREMIRSISGEKIFKLTKKYGKVSGMSEPLTTIYLSEEEYSLFNSNEGYILKKSFYRYPYSGTGFLIEIFKIPETEFILAEAEASSEEELTKLVLPDFISEEVTQDKRYEGYSIASGKF
ncbi:MAG: hypothetical protein JSS91_01320 [Bacteroidetes bacterium]|nr:hypothetical protein [Bacteroidota bacterium]